jgi:hypothetical protein
LLTLFRTVKGCAFVAESKEACAKKRRVDFNDSRGRLLLESFTQGALHRRVIFTHQRHTNASSTAAQTSSAASKPAGIARPRRCVNGSAARISYGLNSVVNADSATGGRAAVGRPTNFFDTLDGCEISQ